MVLEEKYTHVDDSTEVFQTVRDVLFEVVGLNSDSNTSAVHSQVQTAELLFSQIYS